MGIDTLTARAVFLDRDGVINRNVYNRETGAFESPLSPDDAMLHDHVIPALQSLQRAGYLLILVSNQPNCAKGKSTMETLDAIHRRIFAPVEAAGVVFTEVHYCFHHPAGTVSGYAGVCGCRKPSPKFLLQDAQKHHLDLTHSWMVGDRDADVQCGIAAGVKTIRVKPDYPTKALVEDVHATFIVEDLLEAARIILEAKPQD